MAGWSTRSFGETRSSAQDLGDAGPVLDSQALSAYKRRYDDLGSELQEAETFNDVGRVARLRSEREALDSSCGLRSPCTEEFAPPVRMVNERDRRYAKVSDSV